MAIEGTGALPPIETYSDAQNGARNAPEHFIFEQKNSKKFLGMGRSHHLPPSPPHTPTLKCPNYIQMLALPLFHAFQPEVASAVPASSWSAVQAENRVTQRRWHPCQ